MEIRYRGLLMNSSIADKKNVFVIHVYCPIGHVGLMGPIGQFFYIADL